MGRNRQVQQPDSEAISLGPDQHYCILCKQIVNINKQGVAKHEKGRRHQRNLNDSGLRNEAESDNDEIFGFPETFGDDREDEQTEGFGFKRDLYERDLPQAQQIHPHTIGEPVTEVLGDIGQSHVLYVDSMPHSPLDPSKIYVQKHPFASDRQPTPAHITTPALPRVPPYWPFKSLLDFEHAEECTELGLSEPKIDRHMKLAMKTQGGLGPFTLKGAKDMYETLDKAIIFDEEKFVETSVQTTFKGNVYHHKLHHRNLDSMIQDLLADPELEEFWTFDAERRYMASPDGSAMRVYEEYHHGDDMWGIQAWKSNAMGRHTHPILLTLYADATQLSSFGNSKIWTFYITLANLPCRIRNSRGKGGPALGGFLPEVDAPPGLRASDLGDFRCLVYQDCWRIILSSIEIAARIGRVYQLGRSQKIHGTPIAAMKNVDYEEGCRMGCNIGHQGPCGCLICSVPSKSFDDFDHTYAERNSNLATQVVEKSIEGTAARTSNRIPTPYSLGLRPIKNAFDKVTNQYFANHKTIGADDLHVFHSGVYGRTAVPDLLAWMHKAPYPEINEAFASLPSYPDLKHFKKGWCSLQWKSAADWKVIAKLFTPVLHALLAVNCPRRREVLQLFRLYGECEVLITFKMHTDTTLEKMEEVLQKMGVLQKNLQEDLSLRLKTPKMHVLHNHFIDSIRAKGPLCSSSTSFGEACHPQSKQDYTITSKKAGVFEKTMLKIAFRRETIQKIRDRIDLDEGDIEENPSSAVPIGPPDQTQNVTLGSPDEATTLGDFLRHLRIPAEFPQPDAPQLIRSMNTCLYHNCDSFDVKSSYELRVIPQKFARISYVSLHNHELLSDKIRVTSMWYGKGFRYDFVVVNLDNESISYAQVHAMITVSHNGSKYQVALIRLLKSPKRSVTTGYIHAGESSDYRFVSTKCFVRSVYVHPPSGDSSRFIINDLIDQDMYLRLAPGL